MGVRWSFFLFAPRYLGCGFRWIFVGKRVTVSYEFRPNIRPGRRKHPGLGKESGPL